MNAMLEQFLSEAREALESIGDLLMQLETAPDDAERMAQLFRAVHTLKGNSGLFDFPEMTRVLHAAEDLMDAVRQGKVAYSQDLADRLLDAMDFVSQLCDDVAANRTSPAEVVADALRLAQALRAWLPQTETPVTTESDLLVSSGWQVVLPTVEQWLRIPEEARMQAWRLAANGTPVWWLEYRPAEGCFFQGEDPLHQARGTPGIVWGGIKAPASWPPLSELDAYRCVLHFEMLCVVPRNELEAHFRYMPEQVQWLGLQACALVLPQGDPNGGPVYEDFVADALPLVEAQNHAALTRAVRTMLELSSSALWLASALRWMALVLETSPIRWDILHALVRSLRTLTVPDWGALEGTGQAAHFIKEPVAVGSQPWSEAAQAVLAVQRTILMLPDDENGLQGRIKSVTATLRGCLQASGKDDWMDSLTQASAAALQAGRAGILLDWLDATIPPTKAVVVAGHQLASQMSAPDKSVEPVLEAPSPQASTQTAPKSLKVEQSKIDRLMNLIGEMVVAKNAIPYLAQRAEQVYGSRDLAREMRAQYGVIHRIAQDMQDAIMQVSLMPVSSIMQRFPRLVRDTSRRLGKEVQLVLEGQDTAADKNIIESLGDPLVHMVRNSLDHGLETPAERIAAGKTAHGTLTITAKQESDRVWIEIRDDGRGMDPARIKRKAYDKGLIDEATLERITDTEALHLIFLAGFSTAESVSDLSGRGVGMDVVRAAVERVNGSIQLSSTLGQGTQIRLSLPLSMAVSTVMVVRSDAQMFGIPMDAVLETVRVPAHAIRMIKQSRAAVLRGRLVPLVALNQSLGLAAPPLANELDEYATLLVRVGEQEVGLLVDEFHGTADIILKPLQGVLSSLRAYAGSALLGDGSVLMVLNVGELC